MEGLARVLTEARVEMNERPGVEITHPWRLALVVVLTWVAIGALVW